VRGGVGGLRPGVRAACPRVAPAQASALYLCLYYIGSSVAGSAGGVVWADGGWAAVALFAITLLVIALAGVTMSR
jgi:predicted MFS family arabinose efflux permease